MRYFAIVGDCCDLATIQTGRLRSRPRAAGRHGLSLLGPVTFGRLRGEPLAAELALLICGCCDSPPGCVRQGRHNGGSGGRRQLEHEPAAEEAQDRDIGETDERQKGYRREKIGRRET